MRFEHLVQINDPLMPLLEPLSREQLWRGLVRRAEEPTRFVLGLEAMLSLYRAVTGVALDEPSALRIAERVVNLERLFNVREGLTRKDDSLPERLVKEAMPSGPSRGNLVPLEQMLDEYYALMGWDSEGVPQAERMRELGLEEQWQRTRKAMGR